MFLFVQTEKSVWKVHINLLAFFSDDQDKGPRQDYFLSFYFLYVWIA